MANVALIGRKSSTSGVFVAAKFNSAGNRVDVTSCEPYDLIYDSRSTRNANVYRGANTSTHSNSGLTFTDSTHPDLGYIPLTLNMEDVHGSHSGFSSGANYHQISDTSAWTTTSTQVTQSNISHLASSLGTSDYAFEKGSRATGIAFPNATNVNTFVLTIPCQYGKMTDSTYW